MPVADPGASRAVLIGVGTYLSKDLDQLSEAEAGADRLASLLRDSSVWGLADTSVTVLGSKSSETAVLQAVRNAAAEATDALVVYFAGHGLRDRAGKLHLALPAADTDYPQIGTIPYITVREVVQQAGWHLRSWVIILDCCYSGAAGMGVKSNPSRGELATALDESAKPYDAAQRQSPVPSPGTADKSSDPTSDEDEVETDGSDVYGSCVLTSASDVQRSFVLEGALYPEFTTELVDILDQGITGRGATLSLADIWKITKKRMRLRGSPEPQLFPHNGVDHSFQLRNRAHTGTDQEDRSVLMPPRRRPTHVREEPNARARRIVMNLPSHIVKTGTAITPRLSTKTHELFCIPESESLLAVGRAVGDIQFGIGKRLLAFTETTFYASDRAARFACPYTDLAAVDISVRQVHSAGFPEWYVDLAFQGSKVQFGPWGKERAEVIYSSLYLLCHADQ